MQYVLPKNIIIIGSPGSGKTTLSQHFSKKYTQYQILDDLNPLKELFQIEKLLYEIKFKKEKIETFYNYYNQVKHLHSIYNDYINKINSNGIDKLSIIYSKPNDDESFDIIDPNVWNIIFDITINESIFSSNNIIEFARGYDKNFNTLFNVKNNVYNHYFEKIYNINSKLINQGLVILLKTSLDEILYRNEIRAQNGGHKVPSKLLENTFNNNDLLDYIETEKDTISSYGYIQIINLRLPVCVIYNNNISNSTALKDFMLYAEKKAIDFYIRFKAV